MRGIGVTRDERTDSKRVSSELRQSLGRCDRSNLPVKRCGALARGACSFHIARVVERTTQVAYDVGEGIGAAVLSGERGRFVQQRHRRGELARRTGDRGLHAPDLRKTGLESNASVLLLGAVQLRGGERGIA